MLGATDLSDSEGRQIDGILRKPKHLALLAYLAMPRVGTWHRRDSVFAAFWPELEQTQARTSLRSALHTLRKDLEPGTIRTRGDDELSLDPDRISTDVQRLLDDSAAGRNAEAVAEYTGEFLPALHISGAEEFEKWLSAERRRLRTVARKSAGRLSAEREAEGDLAGATDAARRATELDPDDEVAARRLIALLDHGGNRSEAFAAYERFRNHIAEQFAVRPSAETVALVDAIRARRESRDLGESLSSSFIAPPPESATASESDRRIPGGNDDRSRLRRALPFLGLLGAAALVAFAVRERGGFAPKNPAAATEAARSVAVLAFENATPDSTMDYYSYGLTDALIDRLTSSGVLRVIQGPSAYVLRGHRTDTRAIAESLGVANLLASGVLIQGNNLLVSVKLINGADGAVRWSRTYRGNWSDRFALQDSIETEVPRELAALLPGTPRLARSAKFPRTHRAYELYLRGRHEWNSASAQPLGQMRGAMNYYRAALAEDSTYAEAYAGLAAAYVVLGTGNLADFSPQVAADSARRAALKAIYFNDSLPEAHVALAFVHFLYDFDWDGTERELNRARELNPYYSRSPLWPSVYYEVKGQYSMAISEAAKSVETDPLSSGAIVDYARAFLYASRFTEAKAQVARALALDSTGDRLYLTAGEIALNEKEYPLAVRQFEHFAAVTHQSSRALAFLAYTAAVMGDRPRANTLLSTLLRRYQAASTTSFDLAIAYAGFRDNDRAMFWLNKAYDDKSLRPLILDPTFASLRKDPRFDLLLRRMKLKT